MVADLPGVGENLIDHPSVFGLTWSTFPGVGIDFSTFLDPRRLKDFIFRRDGE